ncbi:CoA-transferase family III [Cristinia sonorae]|uniref:CoA-transferase family III n=1 Tax=Cristinia sonorae TaxID=1940300 RepID=A0A8K0UFN0_9AGAR|nr:CoA-transferase family III [Cristinia sonorae]
MSHALLQTLAPRSWLKMGPNTSHSLPLIASTNLIFEYLGNMTYTSTGKQSLSLARQLWKTYGFPDVTLSRLHLSDSPNADLVVNSSFRIGTAAQTIIGLSGLSASHLHELRTGVQQDVTVDARHAVIEFRNEAYYTIDGQPGPQSVWDDLAGIYSAKNGRHIRIHTNFPHHRQGILDILRCSPTRASVSESLRIWDAVEFETEASRRGMVATALRSFEEWDQHPQAKALLGIPPVSVIKVGDAPKRTVDRACNMPLEGIRVLDLTRVLAGPVCGRTLAAYGADVLWITSPSLPALPDLDVETSRGKRTTQLDLVTPGGRETLRSLLNGSDVFLQAYRPGGLRDKGFSVEDVVKSKPGIVYAGLCAYGWEGPWKDRRGFDSLVQTATGFNAAEAEAYSEYLGKDSTVPLTPKPLPMQALDHAAGYFLAFGINAALCKTITEGGSWEVRVSLAAVAQWIRSLGRIDPSVAFGSSSPLPTSPTSPEILALSGKFTQYAKDNEDSEDPRKIMMAVKHAAVLSRTPTMETFAPMILSCHKPEWA